jgi:2-iminobutanoate/2-iminopropanoate deaminase
VIEMNIQARPYSLWRRAGDVIVISGQLGLFPDSHGATVIEGGAPVQLRQALINARKVLAEAGATFDQVFKSTLFLTSMEEIAECNKIWMEFFVEPRPTRSAIAVLELPRGAHIEVELWAYSPLT